jgi:vacuolar-type H+-ATPase subunit H
MARVTEAALTEVERECAEIRERARAAARDRVERAERRAAALVRQARADADADRTEAAARRRAAAGEEPAEVVARAEEEARLIRARAAQRLPALVELVLAHVRVELAALAGDEDVPEVSR